MTDQHEPSPYSRGFIAAAIVVGAVLLCGTLLLLTHPNPADATHTPSGDAPAPSTQLPSPRTPINPATPAPADSTSGSATGSEGCGLPDGDQAVPTKAPAVESWEVSRRVVVPRSSTYGPATTDPDGFRRCFAHSPTGAVYAAYNAIAALGDQHQAVVTATKLMLPGPDTDTLIRTLRTETPSDNAAVQLAGYRILDATRDRVTVVLALPVEEEYMSANLTLVWHHGDWRVVPPPPGQPFGAPFSQHRDLDDFVTWKGL